MADDEVFAGFSEFGQALAEYLAGDPACRGAVLSDDLGDPVDFAHRPATLSALDVQILGAQVERATTGLQAWCEQRGLGACEILVEASHGSLLCSTSGGGCVLAARRDPDPALDPGAALTAFAALRRRVSALID
jgi:hypothetical protein